MLKRKKSNGSGIRAFVITLNLIYNRIPSKILSIPFRSVPSSSVIVLTSTFWWSCSWYAESRKELHDDSRLPWKIRSSWLNLKVINVQHLQAKRYSVPRSFRRRRRLLSLLVGGSSHLNHITITPT